MPGSPTDPNWTARGAAIALAVAWGLWGLDAPLVEDSLFWWVPKALLVAEQGPGVVLAGPLPAAVQAGLTPETTPPQWAGGLPDYAHPTLWYTVLGAALAIAPEASALTTIHLVCTAVFAVAALGFVALGERLGAPWAGLAPLLLPPVLAQAWRPELDLPLLAAVPWALVALLRGHWGAFAALSALSVWCKEPGVLLVAPAVWRLWRERRLRWEAAAPLLALGLWGLVHGGLAGAETLPTSPMRWLTWNLPLSLRLAVWEQGRLLLLAAAPLALWGRLGSLPHQLALVLGLTWVGFFSVVGFSTGSSPGFVLTHVRYFVPGIAVLAVVVAGRWPVLAVPGLLWLHARSPYGPEASLWGIDVARAEAQAAAWIAQRPPSASTVWVGSYTAAAVTQPWAGRIDPPLEGFAMYNQSTDPAALSVGDVVLVADYGEPAGRLERGLTWVPSQTWTVHDASVRAFTITARRESPNPPPDLTQ